MPVHIGIDEAEDDCLVAHECLVVTLAIGNGTLPLPTVRELPINARGVPILVFFLLDELDPVVGDVHGEAVIKTIAARRKGRREAGHAADILGDGDGVGIHLVDELVRERQIADGVIVLMPIEIIAVAIEILAQPVTVIQHRRHAVKAEAVKMVFFQPVFAVREQEMDDIVLAVIKAEAVPCRMVMPIAGVKILVGIACEVPEPFRLIARRVAVHEIHDDRDAHAMCGIDELLELLWRAETGAGRKERAHMITEAAIIRVLLDRHHLNGVVAVPLDPGQNVFCELFIGADLFSIARHADMALINEQRVTIGAKMPVLPDIGLFRRPDLRRENFRLRILHHALAPGGDAFSLAAR